LEPFKDTFDSSYTAARSPSLSFYCLFCKYMDYYLSNECQSDARLGWPTWLSYGIGLQFTVGLGIMPLPWHRAEGLKWRRKLIIL